MTTNPHDCAGLPTKDDLPTKAQLRDHLAHAERQFVAAGYIDSFVRMQSEQAYWARRIDELKGKLARHEYATTKPLRAA